MRGARLGQGSAGPYTAAGAGDPRPARPTESIMAHKPSSQPCEQGRVAPSRTLRGLSSASSVLQRGSSVSGSAF